METIRIRNESPNEIKDDVIFQVLDWYSVDELDDNEESIFKVYIFGVSESQHSITVRVDNYTPYFFVQLPERMAINDFLRTIRRKLGSRSHHLVKYNLIRRKRYYGFENGKDYPFVRLAFSNEKTMRCASFIINKETLVVDGISHKFETLETNVDSVLRIGHLRECLMAGWIKIPSRRCFINYPRVATTEYDVNTNWQSLEPYESDRIASGIRILYFDIECTSEDGSFPDPSRTGDHVIQIGNIIGETGSDKVYKTLHNFKTIDPIPGTTVVAFESEAELLLDWARYIKESDPDVLCGYNIFGFDLSYLYLRAKKLGILEEFTKLTRLEDTYSQYTTKVMQSQQAGYNELKMLSTPGRLQIDLYQIIKREHKLTSYKLDHVGEHFLGENKDPVSPQDIFRFFRESASQRKIIGEYCIQDVNLCVRLLNKLCILPNLVEMAKVTRVPITWLMTRGQQIKAYSQIAYETRKNNFLIPTIKSQEDESKFKGATVLHANRGAYFDRPVCGLDFASLYPSIMIAHNMCYSTVVLDPRYDNIPGVEYSTIEWYEEDSTNPTSVPEGGSADDHNAVVKHRYRFVKSIPGLLSGILARLWATRKATKKLMKAEDDPFQRSVYNGKQLAIKISMNSVYGFTGASNGMLPCRPISSSVTGCGRQMIEQTSRLAKELFNCEIVYGDSVLGDTPVLVKRNGIINTQEIQTFFEEGTTQDYPQFKCGDSTIVGEKQQVIIPQNEHSAMVWTANGWSPIKRVIRHHTSKRIFRVLTHTGVVDVTEDHSLINCDMEQIKPLNLLVNSTTLLHRYPEWDNCDTSIKLCTMINVYDNLSSVPENFRMDFIKGFFVGDGSCGVYKYDYGTKWSWALNNANIDILNTLKQWLNNNYKSYNFKVLDTLKSSGVYKLVPSGNSIKNIVLEFSEFYNNKQKCIPDYILNGTLNTKKWFFYGLYLADGAKCYNEKTQNIKIVTKNKLSASQYYLLCSQIGFDVSINTRNDKPNIYTLTCSHKFKKDKCVVKKIDPIGTINDWVYDIETDDGTFQAGVGQMIVKNTDSCYVIFPENPKGPNDLSNLFDLAKRAAAEISETFIKPIELEFEKFMWPFLLFAKKRYIYLEWTEPTQSSGIEAKGVELVRRDNCPYVKETLNGILDDIMYDKNIEVSVTKAQQYVKDLLLNKVNINNLILSKTLNVSYKLHDTECPARFKKDKQGKPLPVILPTGLPKRKKPTKASGPEGEIVYQNNEGWCRCMKVAHLQLYYKIFDRDHGSAPKKGERVPYIFIENYKEPLQCKKVEDPQYAITNNIKPDSLYYLEHQLRHPLETIFGVLIPNTEVLFECDEYGNAKKRENALVKELKGAKVRKKGGFQDIRTAMAFAGAMVDDRREEQEQSLQKSPPVYKFVM